MAYYGYVRQHQPLPTNDQLKIVADYHCEALFIDKAAYRHQRELSRLLHQVQPGDTVVIASLKVFGESQQTIAHVLQQLKHQQVQVISWSTQLHLTYYKRVRGLF